MVLFLVIGTIIVIFAISIFWSFSGRTTKEGPYVRNTKTHLPIRLKMLLFVASSLKRVGILIPKLDFDDLQKQAMKANNRSGVMLTDFGDVGLLRQVVEKRIRDLNEHQGYHFLARKIYEHTVVEVLQEKLRIVDDLKHYPEIQDIPITSPIIIVGLPRTGSTFLHNLLAQDPQLRAPVHWEMVRPSLPREQPDSRSDTVEFGTTFINTLFPDLKTAHLFEPHINDECWLAWHQAIVRITDAFWASPRLEDFMLNGDWSGVYAQHKLVLQFLTKKYQLTNDSRARCKWLLKCPFHSFFLNEATTQYPDALFIQTHRDPCDVIASWCSLSMKVLGLQVLHIDAQLFAQTQVRLWKIAMDRTIQVREKQSQKSRFLDLSYKKLIHAPLDTVKAIYKHYNLEYTHDFDVRLKDYIANNPQHKDGVHSYNLDQYGLTRENIKNEFKRYTDYFADFL